MLKIVPKIFAILISFLFKNKKKTKAYSKTTSFSKLALMASWSEVTKAFSISEGIILSFILSRKFFHQDTKLKMKIHITEIG